MLATNFLPKIWHATSIKWLALEQVARLFLQFAQSIILARVLTPSDFGLAASVAIVVGLATALADPGVSSVVVQWKRTTPRLEAAASWTAIVAGGLAAVTVAAIAQPVSVFFKAGQLSVALQLSAVSVFVVSWIAVPSGLLMRTQRFRSQAFIAIVSAIVALAVGIGVAIAGYGVYALFVIPIAGSIVTVVMQFTTLGRGLHFRTDSSSIAVVIASAKYLLGVRIADAVQGGVANAIIAKYAGFSDLGMLGRAEGVKQMPISLASAFIGRFYFPLFAEAVRQGTTGKDAASTALISASKQMMLPSIPIFIWLFVFSQEIIIFLYGQNWADAAMLLTMLLPGAVFYLLHLLYANFLLGLGGSRSYFQLDVIKKLILLSSIAIIPFGSIVLYAGGLSACWFIICVIYFYKSIHAGFYIGTGWLFIVVRYISATAIGFALLIIVCKISKFSGPIGMMIIGASFLSVVTPFIYLLFGLISSSELKKIGRYLRGKFIYTTAVK